MKRLKIGQFFGVSLGVGIASLGLYQALTMEQPELFQPGVTEFRSLAEYRQSRDPGGSPAARLVQFDQLDTDDNQIVLPGQQELLPSDLQLSPVIRSNEDIQLLPALSEQGPLEIQPNSKAYSSDVSSGETMEIVPTASVADEVISLAKKTKFSDIQGSDWKSNPFLATNSESVDTANTCVDQFEVKNEFVDADAVIEPLVEPSNLVRSRNEFIEIPAEALHIAKEAAKSSMISVPDEVVKNNSDLTQPNTELESPVVEFEADESFFPGTVMDPATDAGILKLAPAENQVVLRQQAVMSSKEFDAGQLEESVQNPNQIESNIEFYEAIEESTPTTSILSVVPDKQNSAVASEPGLTESVAQRAAHHIEYGKTLARRGATQAAQQEFFASLRLLAQSRDEQVGSNQHSMSLRKAILAIREAEDFMIHDTESQMGLDTSLVVETHRSGILTPEEAKAVSPTRAMQRYFATAQHQLEMAVGCNVVASETLQCLGKLSTVAAGHVSTSGRLDIAKAIVYHQAALTSKPNNFMSANELGVLLARSGQLEEAKQLFKRSLRINSIPQTWANLAKVHARLGEQRLAQLAQSEYQRTIHSTIVSNGGQIQWVSGDDFNASAPMEMHASVAASPRLDTDRSGEPRTKAEEGPKSLGQRLKDLF